MRIRDMIESILFWHMLRMRAKITGEDIGYFIRVSVTEKNGKKNEIGIMHVTAGRVLAILTPNGAVIQLIFERA